MRLLHLSDLHLVPGQRKKQAWVSSLRVLRPDAVIVTGDFMSHVDAVPHVLDTLDPLFDVPGAFVLGSNDYYAPRPLNPARYLAGPSQLEPTPPDAALARPRRRPDRRTAGSTSATRGPR